MVRFPLVVALVLGTVLGLAGCKPSPKPPDPVWQGEKLGSLAPPPRDRLPPAQFLVTATLDIRILELPADNVDKLEAVWRSLVANPIRLTSYNAFSENSFRILFGKIALLDRIMALLTEAEAQQVTTMALSVTNDPPADLPIAEIPIARPIVFVGTDLSKQTVNVGPGILALRFVAEPNPWVRGVRKIIGYPAYKVPTSGAIPELQAQAERRQFYFAAAAFACEMRPGDLLVLGPERYTGERATLGGLFFNKPDETLFFNPNKPKPPARRPAVRVYIVVCTGVNG
jgi:hypothetical protein